MTAEPRQSTAVATIAPPRLPYHPAMEERYGVDRSQWKVLCESVFPNAKTAGAIALALGYCKTRNLDIFKRPVHIVPIWDPKGGPDGNGGWVETVWPGISEHRTTAMRTGLYAGMDSPRMGPDVTRKFSGTTGKGTYAKKVEVEMTFPQYCEITVYRKMSKEKDSERVAFPGPRVYWTEYFSAIGKSGVPNERWQRAPYQMLEKCAEAAALRRAFPEEIGNEWTAEEVGGAATMVDITPSAGSPIDQPEPTRDQFTENKQRQATDVEHDEGAEDGAEDAATETQIEGTQGEADAPTESTEPFVPEGGWQKFVKFSDFVEYSTDFLAQATAIQATAWNANYAAVLQDKMMRGTPPQKEAVNALLKTYGELTRAPASTDSDFPGDQPSKSAA